MALSIRRRGALPAPLGHSRLAAADPGPVSSGIDGQRDRRHRLSCPVLVRARIRYRRRWRSRHPALRRGRLRGAGLGQRPPGGQPRGWPHAVLRRHHPPAEARRAADRQPSGHRRSTRPDEAARQAGLAARTPRHLVSADHRHLAVGLAGEGRGDVRREDSLDAARRQLCAALRGAPRRRRARRSDDRGHAAPWPATVGKGPLPADRRRGRPRDRAGRSGHRRFSQRAAVEPGTPDAARRDRAAASRRRNDRRIRVLRRATLRLDHARPLHAERAALHAADGARPGVLARHLAGRAGRSGAAPRCRAGQGDGIQRRAQAPEDRRPALPLLGRSARPAGLGRNALGLPLHAHRDPPNDPRMVGGDRARLQPSLHRRLDPVQRVVGRARPDRDADAAPCRRSALPPDQDTRLDASGDRQRRLGKRRDRHHRHSRLRRQHRASRASATAPRRTPSSCSTAAGRAAGS